MSGGAVLYVDAAGRSPTAVGDQALWIEGCFAVSIKVGDAVVGIDRVYSTGGVNSVTPTMMLGVSSSVTVTVTEAMERLVG